MFCATRSFGLACSSPALARELQQELGRAVSTLRREGRKKPGELPKSFGQVSSMVFLCVWIMRILTATLQLGL